MGRRSKAHQQRVNASPGDSRNTQGQYSSQIVVQEPQITVLSSIFDLVVSPVPNPKRRPSIYRGDSERSKRRRRAEIAKASKGCRPLTAYFHRQEPEDEDDESESPPAQVPRQYTSHQFESVKLREGLSDLGSACKSFKNTRKAAKTASDLSIEKGYDYLRLLAVFSYFNGLLSNLGKMEASKAAALTMMPFVKGGSEDYLSRNIRAWGAYFYDNGCLLVSQQGKHRKFDSLIEDEDVVLMCFEWIRSTKPSMRTAFKFNKFLVNELFPVFGNASDNYTGSERTACDWLNKLGFPVEDSSKRKGSIYVDGHERVDVVEYRKGFVKRFRERYLPHIS